jgi:hypothetical protein
MIQQRPMLVGSWRSAGMEVEEGSTTNVGPPLFGSSGKYKVVASSLGIRLFFWGSGNTAEHSEPFSPGTAEYGGRGGCGKQQGIGQGM